MQNSCIIVYAALKSNVTTHDPNCRQMCKPENVIEIVLYSVCIIIYIYP